MGTSLPKYYTDIRKGETTEGDTYELVMIASHVVDDEPLFIMKSLSGGLSVAVPFGHIGDTWKVDYSYTQKKVCLACEGLGTMPNDSEEYCLNCAGTGETP